MARGKRFTHREFVYTGNHPNGTNTVYENGQQALMQHIGVKVDSQGINQYNLFGDLAGAREFDKDAAIVKNGFRIQLIKASSKDGGSFGYEFTHVYRVEQVQ